jgi:hypothetical protein
LQRSKGKVSQVEETARAKAGDVSEGIRSRKMALACGGTMKYNFKPVRMATIKKMNEVSVIRMWRKGNGCTLLAVM